jgi:hypothetical protein
LPPHVAHHSYDGEPRAVGIPRAKLKSSTHRIAPGPQAANHRLVDYRNARSIRPVPDGKEAAAEQGRAKGFEEIRADLVSPELHALGNRSVVPLGREDLFSIVTDEKIADDAGALNTRNRLNLSTR